jgi:hypothetical protein
MPVIAFFHGIKIMISSDDHDPPHFHARAVCVFSGSVNRSKFLFSRRVPENR